MKRLLLPILLCCPLLALAQSEEKKEEGEPGKPAITYVALTPALVGNFQSAAKMGYYKADVALRVSSKEADAKVKYHEPLIRNQLVMLFAQQSQDTLENVEGKEKLREEALKQVQHVLEQEEGTPLVEDLLFNNLVVQP